MLKKLAAVHLIGLATLAPLSGFSGAMTPPRTGAYGPGSTSSREVVQAAEFAIAAQLKVIRTTTGDPSAQLRFVRINAAE